MASLPLVRTFLWELFWRLAIWGFLLGTRFLQCILAFFSYLEQGLLHLATVHGRLQKKYIFKYAKEC